MSGKIDISRELAGLLLRALNGGDNQLTGMEHGVAFRELRALLADPVVERQEPKGAILRFREYVGKGQGGRDLWHDWTEWSTGTVEYAKSKLDQVKDLTHIQFEVEWLYTSPPAPVADDMVRLLTRARIYARGEFRDEIDACLRELNQ